jgi:hypothetical protein
MDYQRQKSWPFGAGIGCSARDTAPNVRLRRYDVFKRS